MVVATAAERTMSLVDTELIQLTDDVASAHRQLEAVTQEYLKAIQDGRLDADERRRMELSARALATAAFDLVGRLDRVQR